MQTFCQWVEARVPKIKVLDKVPAYSTYNLPRPNGPHEADKLLKAFEHGYYVPPQIIADMLEERGHPNAAFFRTPEMMAKAHFYMALPNNAYRGGWNDPNDHNEFRNYLLNRYRDFFAGKHVPNYRSVKGQREHGQYVSFFHDLIHAPERVPPQAHMENQ